MKIELKNIQKKYSDVTPLKDINAVINEGDVVAIIGPSGTGKSTLLRAINLIEPPTSGDIYIDGLEITKNKANFKKIRQKIGMVFQSYNLFNHLTVVENVMLALIELKKMPRQEAYDRAILELSKVGLSDRALKYPNEISGGQKQRVSIARTLAMDPELILLDEPTSALDPTMVREVESVICNLAQTGKTMVIVTHEMRLARAIANRIFYLDQGVVYEEGSPQQIFDSPKRERTSAFVNKLKTIKYRFITSDFDYNDFSSALTNFISNNAFDEKTTSEVMSILNKVATEFVPKHSAENVVISLVSELNPETNKTKFILYSSQTEDIANDIKQIFAPIAHSIVIETISDPDFAYKTSIII